MLRSALLVLTLYIVTGSCNPLNESYTVVTTQGPVRGYRRAEGVFAFYNIPYATAPTGLDKYKAPLPPPTWDDVFEAIDERVVCPQDVRVVRGRLIRENCLIANIYVPDTERRNLPVMVYVHGGGFQIGYGEMDIPIRLVQEHEIIVVNFNYRLNVHGFLCLGTEDVPGNAGMKDQVALLRWVQRNIESFGGNPQDVTLEGCSAGGASVDLLMLSNMTRGLFHKVIGGSGATIGAFAVQVDPIENAKEIARTLNFTNVDDFYALENFYKTMPLLTRDYFMNRTDSVVLASPCVERDVGVERFLEEAPYNILRRGDFIKYPLLYGFANREGFWRVDYFDIWPREMNEDFSNFLPGDLQFENMEEKRRVAQTVKEFYFGDRPVSEENILAYVDYFTDVMFGYSMVTSAKLQVEAGNDQVYLHEFNYMDEGTRVIPHTNGVPGNDHCTQSMAVFDEPKDNLTAGFIQMKADLRQLYYNFIVSGRPVPEGSNFTNWPAVGANGSPYMSLDAPLELINSGLLQSRVEFWDTIYARHRAIHSPPPTPPRNDSYTVVTSQGTVRGYRRAEGVFAFYNIPYATAPTGLNKYKAPLPPPTWEGVFDAIDERVVCPQDARDVPGRLVRENCLIANVYVPETERRNLPVMVYVHGGGFQIGFGDIDKPIRLVQEHDIIVVNFNYRLNVHGFLCLGTEDVPGNAGMKDQVALLRWVQRNIESFGGNPQDVTLEGCSAGGASVDLLMLSNMTRGLFHKVIGGSGATIGAFAVQVDPIENAKEIARTLNFTNVDDFHALEHFFKTMPLLTEDYFMNRTDSVVLASPCVERDVGEERFLEAAPYNILRSGDYIKYPLLYGFANKEGFWRVDYFDIWRHGMNEDFSNFLPGDLQFESMEEKRSVAQRVKEFYFGDRPVSEENILAYVDYFTDVMFGYSMVTSAKLQVEAGNDQVYLHEFNYMDEGTRVIPHTNGAPGNDHCTQSMAVFDDPKDNLTAGFIQMKADLRQLYYNFISSGRPVPEGSNFTNWPAVGANGSPYMSLDIPLQLINSGLLQRRIEFWDTIYARHRAIPSPPPTPPSSSFRPSINPLLIVALLFLVPFSSVL